MSRNSARAQLTTPSWWGEWSFDRDTVKHWRIGPLDLWIGFDGTEWVIYRKRGDDPLDTSLEIASPAAAPDRSSGSLEVDRIAIDRCEGNLTLAPRLADRIVIVRPSDAFQILEGSRVEIFVSSPLWLAISADSDEGHSLIEFPIFRPSDTWFGPSTRDGAAAYATSTSCRVDLEGLPIRPHRAITSLRIYNPGPGSLAFDRAAVPVPNLSVYAGAAGHIWTEAISVTRRDKGGGLADLEVLPGAPAAAGSVEQLAEPREAAETRILRVFEALF